MHMSILSEVHLFLASFVDFFPDPSPQCVPPPTVDLVDNGQLSKLKKESRFRGVIRYKCRPAGRIVKQATCVSGNWSPEIECTGMFLDFHTISSFYVGMINALY